MLVASTTATTRASRLHARMSSTAAQARVRAPTSVRYMPRSVRMRASTGKAVTAIEAPMKRANGKNRTSSPRTVPCCVNRTTASANPRANGSTTDVAEITAATRSLPRISARSSSRPTMNMKITRPSSATTFR